MGLFDRFKTGKPTIDPAPDSIYEMLFCDNIEWYKSGLQNTGYPWDVLLSANPLEQDLMAILQDPSLETRAKIFAAHKLHAKGQALEPKQLFAVIVEVAFDEGLDVLASYSDGSARYLNYSGSMVIWETKDETSDRLTANLFEQSMHIVNRIRPWNQPRKPRPVKSNTRISFLVSDGLYFGEGPINVLFSDKMAQPAFHTATTLMQYLTSKAV